MEAARVRGAGAPPVAEAAPRACCTPASTGSRLRSDFSLHPPESERPPSRRPSFDSAALAASLRMSGLERRGLLGPVVGDVRTGGLALLDLHLGGLHAVLLVNGLHRVGAG